MLITRQLAIQILWRNKCKIVVVYKIIYLFTRVGNAHYFEKLLLNIKSLYFSQISVQAKRHNQKLCSPIPFRPAHRASIDFPTPTEIQNRRLNLPRTHSQLDFFCFLPPRTRVSGFYRNLRELKRPKIGFKQLVNKQMHHKIRCTAFGMFWLGSAVKVPKQPLFSPIGGIFGFRLANLASGHKKSPTWCRACRSYWIRTSDLYVPNVARYQLR